VGHDSVPAVVLLRLRLHGRDEHSANRQRQTPNSALAPREDLEAFEHQLTSELKC